MASNDWKKKNYNLGIKVSQSTIDQLMANKSFEGNVKAFKSGATAQQREAMNRFYGKTRVNAALGSTVAKQNKTYPGTTKGGTPGAIKNGNGFKNSTTIPKPAGPSNISKVGNFVKNELLGVDDFSRTVKYAKQGNIVGAAKSALTGAGELGTTAAAIGGSLFTGGATGAALISGKAAQVAARQAGKQVFKKTVREAVKTGTKKDIAKAVVKKTASYATGTAATGAAARGTAKVAGKTYTAIVKQAAKRDFAGVRTNALANASTKHAASMTNKAADALKAQKSATSAKVAAEKAIPKVKTGINKGKPKMTGKEASAAKKAAANQAAAKKAASNAGSVARNANTRAADLAAKQAARKAAMKKTTQKARVVAGTAAVSKISGKAVDYQIQKDKRRRNFKKGGK